MDDIAARTTTVKGVQRGGGGKMGEADVIENAVNNKVHGAIYGILYMCGI